MSRQDANAAFALSSFLQGTNATYIDEIYARYENDPSSVDSEWQEFFKSLKDTPSDVRKNAEGPSWAKSNWPVTPQDDLTSALDGNWVEVEKVVGKKLASKAQDAGGELASTDVHQATRDSVRALMLIRAYRMRGHFHAKLDPLGIEAPRDREELDPRSYGFTEADFDRKIFLDHVLGLDQLVEDRSASFARERDFLVRTLDALLNPGFLRGVGDVHELDAERLAVGALADHDDLAQGAVFETEHVIEENPPVEIGFGEAIGARVEFFAITRRLDTERIELGVEMSAHPVGANQHQCAHRIARGLMHVG